MNPDVAMSSEKPVKISSVRKSGGPSRASWLAVALIGAAIGFLSATLGRGDILFREAASQELPHYFLARALEMGPLPSEPTSPSSAPLYPVILTALHLVKTDAAAARTFQLILLGALIPLAAAFAASRTFGRRVGLPAGIVTLVTGPLWIHLGWLHPVGWQALLGLLTVGLLAEPRPLAPSKTRKAAGPATGGGGVPRALLAGVLIALARLLGAAWAPFLAVLAAAALFLRRRPVPALALLLGSLLVFTAPLLNRGRIALAGPVLGDGGNEMAYGFHDGASGVEPRRGEKGDWRWMTIRDMTLGIERARGVRTTPDEAASAWYGRTIRWMVSHPIETALLLVKKGWLLLSGYDPPSPDSLVFRATRTAPWALPLLYLTAIPVGLGLAGLWFSRRGAGGGTASPSRPDDVAKEEPADSLPVILLGAATLLCGMLYYARSGDRLAFLLALSGPAAWALMRVTRRPVASGLPGPAPAGAEGPATSGTGRPALLVTAAALALVGALPWLLVAPRVESAAEDQFLVAGVLERGNHPAESLHELEKTLRIDPSHAAARLSLAGALARDGLFDQATEEARKVVAEQPRMGAGWRLLALLTQRSGHYEDAAAAYRKLIEIEPLSAETNNNLGTMYVALGRYDEAVAALRRAIEIDPNYRSARINLSELEKRGREGIGGAQLQFGGAASGGTSAIQQGIQSAMQSLQAGDVATAEQKLTGLRNTFGATPELDFASGTLAMQKGNVNEAIELFERSRSQLANNPYLLNNLGTAYAQAHRVKDALATWEEVLRIDPTNDLARKNIEAVKARAGEK